MKKISFNYIFFVILASFVLFLIIEMILRVFVINSSQLSNYGYNPKGLGDLLPNKNFVDTGVKRLPYLVITNSQGLRNEEEIDFSKDNFRILTIGDSFTYGPYVNNQDTWQAVLEKKLKDKFPDKKIQVLNAGVAGYTITDEFEYLKEKGVKTKPNLVILGIYANDINDLKPEKREIYARKKQKKKTKSFLFNFISLAKNTAIFNFLEKERVLLLTAKSVQSKNVHAEQTEQNSLKKYISYLDEFINYTKKNNLRFLVILFPEISQLKNNKNYFQDEITKDLKEKKVKYINFFDIYKDNDFYFFYLSPYNFHLSAVGNYFSADYISKHITSENYLQ